MTTEKSCNQFIKEMREAGFDFEFKATNNDGLVVKSKNWVDDNKKYIEVIPSLNHLKVKNEAKSRKKVA